MIMYIDLRLSILWECLLLFSKSKRLTKKMCCFEMCLEIGNASKNLNAETAASGIFCGTAIFQLF